MLSAPNGQLVALPDLSFEDASNTFIKGDAGCLTDGIGHEGVRRFMFIDLAQQLHGINHRAVIVGDV